MEVKGKVIQLLALQTGMGKKGPWKKQEFILETQSQYPKKVCFSVWGEKVDQYNLAVGDLLNVAVDLESREYNGRWYTDVKAWKVEVAGGSGTTDIAPNDEVYFDEGQMESKDDLPF